MSERPGEPGESDGYTILVERSRARTIGLRVRLFSDPSSHEDVENHAESEVGSTVCKNQLSQTPRMMRSRARGR